MIRSTLAALLLSISAARAQPPYGHGCGTCSISVTTGAFDVGAPAWIQIYGGNCYRQFQFYFVSVGQWVGEWKLDPYGFPGCSIWNSFSTILTVPRDHTPRNSTMVWFRIPNDPRLRGFEIDFQAMGFPSSKPTELQVSKPARLHVRY